MLVSLLLELCSYVLYSGKFLRSPKFAVHQLTVKIMFIFNEMIMCIDDYHEN